MRIISFLLCLSIIVMRAWPRLVYAELWAEDSLIFVNEALNIGWVSLLNPFAGSFHTVQRLVCLVGIQVPFLLFWLPQFICCVYFVFLAAIASKLVEADLNWLIPSRGARMAAAFIFCCLPGLGEMIGNLCNLNWVLFFWLVMTALRDLKSKFSLFDLFGTFMVAASTGTFPVLAPLFFWRAWKSRALAEAPAVRRNWAALGIILCCTLFLIVFKGDRPGLPKPFLTPLEPVTTYLSDVIKHLAILPWLGKRVGVYLTAPEHNFQFVVFSALFFYILCRWLYRYGKQLHIQALVIMYGSISTWIILAWLARPGSIETFQLPMDLSVSSRYLFACSHAALLFWLGILHPKTLAVKKTNWRTRATWIYILLNVIFLRSHFEMDEYGPERYWKQTAAELTTAVFSEACLPPIEVKAHPGEHWFFTYRSPHCN